MHWRQIIITPNIPWSEKKTSFSCTGFTPRGKRRWYSFCKENGDRSFWEFQSNQQQLFIHPILLRFHKKYTPECLESNRALYWMNNIMNGQPRWVTHNQSSAQLHFSVDNLTKFVDRMILTKQRNTAIQSPMRLLLILNSLPRQHGWTNHLC